MPRRRLHSESDWADDGRYQRGEERPPQRNAANARERARMRVLATAFCRLKTTLPWVPADTKLSKLDTLRLATSYIAHLSNILQDNTSPTQHRLQPTLHPLNLTWPFTFQQNCGGSPQHQHHQDPAGEEHNGLHQPATYPPPYSDSVVRLG